MRDPGLPVVDGAPACPFVAFEHERDERATSPDHRHRCYAEARPAPRALAHQEAYCLSSSFPVCPTFQDWARREAARARTGSGAMPRPEDQPQRNPPRDWSAPPPWAGPSEAGTAGLGGGPSGADTIGGAGAAGAAAMGGAAGAAAGAWPGGPVGPTGPAAPAGPTPARDDPGGFRIERPQPGAGLAGSAADRLAGPDREPLPAPDARASRGTDLEEDERDAVYEEADDGDDFYDRLERGDRRRADRRGGFRLGGRRPSVGDTRRGRRSSDADSPSWERPIRQEAYPTLKTRMGLPSIPRVGLLALALAAAALLLFFLPGLLGLGRPDGGLPVGQASPTPSAGASSGPPTPTPGPTPRIYVVVSGDTLERIWKRFGVTREALLAANPQITNENRINIGDEIVIPSASPDSVPGSSATPSASP